MQPSPTIDLIEELRLRHWARMNYVPAEERSAKWHPIILNEMAIRDAESASRCEELRLGQHVVPLLESRGLRLDGPHAIGRTSRHHSQVAHEPSEFHFS